MKAAEGNKSVLKVAIVGCGKIADDHASQIQRIKGCEIVAVCDREPLMARQLSERFNIKSHFSDLSQLLTESTPDVVHVTTPPQSHFDIAKLCLDAGCHVYVEKPFTLYEEDAKKLIALANEKNLKITAGHDYQFKNAARRMRTLIQSGYIGAPVHMESFHCYGLERSAYASALLSDKKHWVRRLPGQLLQNIISHGIARIAENLTTDSPEVKTHGFVSECLKSMGETEMIDELRVIISEETGTTAYFTFSSQMRPSLHQFRIYGSKNGLVLDHDQDTLVKLRGTRYTSYAENFMPLASGAAESLRNLGTNMRLFASKDLNMKNGMKFLIEAFYRSIKEGAPDPIPYREILLTARIMDSIFAQLYRGESKFEMQSAPLKLSPAKS